MTGGKVMIPLRQTLEAMGGAITYDSKTKIAAASIADQVIEFKVGGTDVTVSANGTKSAETIAAAPYIKRSAIYVSARDLCDLLGYGIGWDAAEKTVVIIDPTPLLGTVDEDFSIISSLTESDLDLEKSYTTNGKFNMNVTSYADPESVMPGLDVSVTGSMSGIQQKSNADMVMKMAFNFDNMLKDLTAEEKAMAKPLLDLYKNVDMKIKMDGETGVTYMNSSFFSMIDPTKDANTWYKMNIYDTYADMGIDLKSLNDMTYSRMKLSEALRASFSSLENIDTSTYQDLKASYSFLKVLIGNDAFQTRTTGNITTHTLNLDVLSIAGAMTKTALTEGIPADDPDLTEIGDLLKYSNIGANIIIREKGDTLYNYAIKGSCILPELSCSFDMSGDSKNVECKMTADLKDLMKMNMEVESHVAETSQAPDLSLPADAVIVDYQQPLTPTPAPMPML